MLKLRTLLLHDILYYIIFFLSLSYFLFVVLFVNYHSHYQNITNIKVKIVDITKKDYKIKLIVKDLKTSEKFIAYYYIKDKEILTFINTYHLGDNVYLKVTEKEINNNTVPNTFNYKKYLYNQRIYKVLEINSIKKIKSTKNIIFLIKDYMLKKSFKFKKSYKYINGLIFGKNDYLDTEVLDSYREIGISHLFAISGTHISVFIFIISKILEKMKLLENKKYIIIILFLIFYMFLTNFTMSVVRSALFTVLLLINKIFYFYIKPQNLLLLTLSIIIFYNPLLLFNIGLQYSFLISMSLILMKDYINSKNKKISKLFVISFISFLVSFPITVGNFYQVNFLSIIYNCFYVPYVSFVILPLTLISYIFPIFDTLLFYLTKLMENLSIFLSNFSFLKLSFCKVNLLIYFLYYIIIIINLSALKKNNKKNLILFLVLLIIHNSITFNKENYLMFFDVGQGDSTLIVVNKTVNIIDTGGNIIVNDSKYTYDIAKQKLIPYLNSQGIKQIDNLFLTHGDADHMRESIYLINKFKVKRIYINCNKLNKLEQILFDKAYKKSISINKLTQNNTINLSGTKLFSLNKNRIEENDSSIVLYLNFNNYKILLTGDIPQKVEKDILNEYNLSNLDIIKLAHHGSNTSSSMDFLIKTNPKYAIISVGINNRYNHPSKETIDSLNKLNIDFYKTSNCGSIKFNLNNGTLLLYPP